jgi:hypothetical protein
VARAKRTDRAEARRRYRAQLADAEALEGDGEGIPASAAPTAPATASRPGPTPPPPGRPSIVYAFRASFRQVNFREDLAYLPTLVLRTKAVWIPVALSIASAVALVIGGLNTLTVLFFQYFAYILPVGALFLAGFLAPRASWLAGLIVGAAATAVLGATLAAGVLGSDLGPDLGPNILLNGLVTSTIGGAFVSSAAAWYKRFLSLANPNRGARRPQPARNRPAPRRR